MREFAWRKSKRGGGEVAERGAEARNGVVNVGGRQFFWGEIAD